MVLDAILDLYYRCFSFFYITLNDIKMTENVSVYDYLIVIFIATIVIGVVFSAFGASGIMRSYGSTTSAIRNRKIQQNQNNAHKNKSKSK